MIMKNELESLKDHQVEINCNGVSYAGRLLGATEDEVYLQTSIQYMTLPMDGISGIKKIEI